VLAPVLRPVKRANGKPAKVPYEYVEITGNQVIEACMGFADLVAARRVVHPDDPLLTSHVVAVQRLKQGDGWRFTRLGAGHADAAYAAAGAVHTALTVPFKPKLRPVVVTSRRRRAS
jgi:hypothetical protein